MESRLVEALTDTPAVLVHGPRQCGKTTLAKMVGEPRGYAYFNFNDPMSGQAAESDPVGFAADLPERTILDEDEALRTSERAAPLSGAALIGSTRQTVSRVLF